MSDGQDILKKLRDYEVEPPVALRMNIFVELDNDFHTNAVSEGPGLLGHLQELEIAPPSFLFPVVEKRIVEDMHLSFLQQHETVPPPNAYAAIIEKIAEPIRQQETATISKGVRKIYRYQAAAVVILVALIGFLIYQATRTTNHQPIEVAKNKVIPPVNNKDSNAKSLTPSTNIDNRTLAVVKPKKKKKKAAVAAEDEDVSATELTMSIDDYKFPIIDNDLLCTFASFTYTALPSFVTDEEKKEFSIRVDQYAAINVSETMTKLIRRMNLYRKNGKLMNKARRARAMQEKWKNADADQFDNSLIKNPMDALDLAEFIFK